MATNLKKIRARDEALNDPEAPEKLSRPKKPRPQLPKGMPPRTQRRLSTLTAEDAVITSENGEPTHVEKDTPEKKRERHEQRLSWFIAEGARQAPNRAMMAKCESAYDSEQWDHQEAEDVRDRGQNPVVYNEIKPTIDWLIGTERRSRVDFFVVAEGDEEEDEDDARNKTKLLKYLDDVNRAGFERSYAAEDCFKAGLGWLEVGLRGDRTGTQVYVGAESWRNILWDSLGSTKRDVSDSRYMFRLKVVDLDVAIAFLPDHEEELRAVAHAGDDTHIFADWMGIGAGIQGLDQFNQVGSTVDYMTPRPVDLFNPRPRVLLMECWSREPVKRGLGKAGLGDPVEFRMRVSIMTQRDTLIEAWSPFKHDGFPFIPLWAYRNRRTGLPYGPIFPLLGPQEALNHRMSKSLYEASCNQVEIEKSAIDKSVMGIDELRDEWNRPDGVPVYADGALTNGRVRKRENSQAARDQLMLADRDIMHMRQMSGVSGENRGLETNANSGKAIIAKQEQGGLLTAELFDNLLLARQMEGELTLSLAEQFMLHQFTARVAGEGGKFDRTKFNQPQPDGSYLNDISARRAHFVVGEQAWKQAYAEAAFESLMMVLTQLASAAPQVVVNLLDVVFEMHPNLPRKKTILQRIRSVNGQQDEDGKMTPEQQAAQDEQAAIAKAQFQAQMAQMQATIKEAQAKGEKLDSEAMFKRLETLKAAAEAAAILVSAAGTAITPVADELLASAGFKDKAAPGPVIDGQQPPADPAPVEALPPPVQPMAPSGVALQE